MSLFPGALTGARAGIGGTLLMAAAAVPTGQGIRGMCLDLDTGLDLGAAISFAEPTDFTWTDLF